MDITWTQSSHCKDTKQYMLRVILVALHAALSRAFFSHFLVTKYHTLTNLCHCKQGDLAFYK